MIKIKDVLEKFQELSRDQLDYWERRGYIQAQRKGSFRVYPGEALTKIRLMYRYTRMGLTPREADRKADNVLGQAGISSSEKFAEDVSGIDLLYAPVLEKKSIFELAPGRIFYMAEQVLEALGELKRITDWIVPCDLNAFFLCGYVSAMAHQSEETLPPFATLNSLPDIQGRERKRVVILIGKRSSKEGGHKTAKQLEDRGYTVASIVALDHSKSQLEQLRDKGYPVVGITSEGVNNELPERDDG